MISQLESFWCGASTPLRLGFIGFCIAGVGSAVGFITDPGPHNPWAYVVWFVTVGGVLCGFVAVIWGWVRFVKGRP